MLNQMSRAVGDMLDSGVSYPHRLILARRWSKLVGNALLETPKTWAD
jgi:hypothetical protein